MDFSRSASAGRLPNSVLRNLNLPDVKSLGLGLSIVAATPFPFPSIPWQTAHRDSKIDFPRTVFGGAPIFTASFPLRERAVTEKVNRGRTRRTIVRLFINELLN